jgi:hypothetical protein
MNLPEQHGEGKHIQLWCDISQQTFVSYISKKYLIDADITAIKFPVIVIA